MKYIISYECRIDGKIFNGTVGIESEFLPSNHDNEVLNLVGKDSVQFYNSGTAGIKVLNITPANL